MWLAGIQEEAARRRVQEGARQRKAAHAAAGRGSPLQPGQGQGEEDSGRASPAAPFHGGNPMVGMLQPAEAGVSMGSLDSLASSSVMSHASSKVQARWLERSQ